MLARIAFAGLIVLACGAPAIADDTLSQANVETQAISTAFEKAFGACDVVAATSLYEDNAVAIYPGQGEEAKGKAEIGKMFAQSCKSAAGSTIKPISGAATPIGTDYIINVGKWENTGPGPDGKPMTIQIRTTELLHKTDGKWRYLVDHASIGTPPASPMTAQSGTSAQGGAAASSAMPEQSAAPMESAMPEHSAMPESSPSSKEPTATPTSTPNT